MADDLTPADDTPAEPQSSFFFSPDDSQTTVIQPGPPTIVILGTDDEPLVTIRTDGTLEYGDRYEPDEAARIFWEAVSREAGGGHLAAVTASPRNCRRCHCSAAAPACEHCNCCDIPDLPSIPCPACGEDTHDAHEWHAPVDGRVRCPGWAPPGGTHPVPPEPLPSEEQLRDRLWAAETALQRIREALPTDEPPVDQGCPCHQRAGGEKAA